MPTWRDVTMAISRSGALLAFTALLSACSSVPSQEMSDARRAMDAARESGAQRHTPRLMEEASRTLTEASAALRTGNYDTARELAVSARTSAISARMVGDAVARAELAIDAARLAGRPSEGARQMLDRALDAARDGEPARAVEMANRAAALAS